jgi:hypothetical protein
MLATRRLLTMLSAAVLAAAAATANAAPLTVTSVAPARNVITAAASSPVSITFDRAVLPSSINAQTFRVFGRWSGAAPGTYTFSNGDRTVTFTRSRPFSAGENVLVNLSHDIQATDLMPLRAAGFAYSFWIRTGVSTMVFDQIDVMSNRINNVQTRIYGTSASDLNEDGFIDLTTVNEVSADVRVFLNRADGSGLYHPFLTPQAIGEEASPNEAADFNNDGHADLCIAAVVSSSVWVLLGAGDGTFSTITELPVGLHPHGVAALDIDGDGDPDIVNSNTNSNNLSVHVNNGSGVFAPPVYFEGGVNAEYGLSAADMNGDDITDVVVVGRDGQQILTQLCNGAGGFAAAGPAQASGGNSWVAAVGDLNADGKLDAALANSTSNNGAICLGNGNGTYAAPVTVFNGGHTVASDLGDLDGDGDLDWVLSSFGAGHWRVYRNNGSGTFAFHVEIDAPNNPSCAVLVDFDNDSDLDLALSDEIADVVVLLRNRGTPTDVVAFDAGITALANAPDPFRDATVVRFHLQQAGDVAIAVYDAAGRQVHAARLAALRPGWQTHRWAPFDGAGRRLANGVYYCEVTSGGAKQTDRMVLLR